MLQDSQQANLQPDYRSSGSSIIICDLNLKAKQDIANIGYVGPFT